jgi:hypothetical protein
MKTARAPSPRGPRIKPCQGTGKGPKRAQDQITVRVIPAEIEDARVWDDVVDALARLLELDKPPR